MTFPGTAPARPVHVPTPPTGVPNVGGRDPLEHLDLLTKAVHQNYSQYRTSIPEGVGPDELASRAGEFAYTDQALAIPAAVEAARQHAEQAKRVVSDELGNLRVDPSESAQTAARRFWDRTSANLDAARKQGLPQAAAAARAAVANAPDDQVATLVEELSDWCSRNGVPVDSWLQAALASKAGLDNEVSHSRLKQKQFAVVVGNALRLQRNLAKDTEPGPLLDYTAVRPDPYTNPADV
jgi:hypothetical protein